ncbi:MAG: hypothetical protein RIR65_295 [Planctomycetota bacterium]
MQPRAARAVLAPNLPPYMLPTPHADQPASRPSRGRSRGCLSEASREGEASCEGAAHHHQRGHTASAARWGAKASPDLAMPRRLDALPRCHPADRTPRHATRRSASQVYGLRPRAPWWALRHATRARATVAHAEVCVRTASRCNASLRMKDARVLPPVAGCRASCMPPFTGTRHDPRWRQLRATQPHNRAACPVTIPSSSRWNQALIHDEVHCV